MTDDFRDTGLRVAREPAGAGPAVQGFAGNGFRVDGQVYAGVLLTPERAIDWPAGASLDLTVLAPLLALAPAPEFILIGTGATLTRPATGLVAALEARGIGVEAMDSRAAARAWGVLRAEGRWIAAALAAL